MDNINFNLESNFTLYVNESIKQISLASKKSIPKYYMFSAIFGGIAIELGLALIVSQGMNENIYNQKNRVSDYEKIKKLFEGNLSKYTKKLFKEYEQYNPTLNNPITNITVKAEMLKDEISSIKEARNDLVHNEGSISPVDIEHCLFRSLLFLNMLLPIENKFNKILNTKNIEIYLEKSRSEEALNKISNAFQILQHQDDDHYVSSIEDEMYRCADCGYTSMINISGDKDSMPGYLCLLCVSHGYLEDCSVCGKLIQHGDEYEWNDERRAYVCEDCKDEFEYKIRND